MRGARAKSLRKYVAATFPYLPAEDRYMKRADGCIFLIKQCQRAVFQLVKRNYKLRKQKLELKN